MLKMWNSSIYGLFYDNKLNTPILNYYFKQVNVPYDLYYEIKESRRKIGLRMYNGE